MADDECAVVDVVFDLAGTSLPSDNAWPLLQGMLHRLPWLESEALAGVHPLRAVPTGYGVVLLAQRAKLVLRIPEQRLGDSLLLQGADLDVAGSVLRVGGGKRRALRPSATLHALRVATGESDEARFQDDVTQVLRALHVECRFISGRPRRAGAGAREIAGFGLALHGLRPADSLRIQAAGIGDNRCLGWGVFVPAKAIVAAEG